MRASNAMNPSIMTTYTCGLTQKQAKSLEDYLRAHDFLFRDVPYARFAGEKEKLTVVFYQSGKLVVQGKGTQEFVEFVLEPLILQEAKLGYETVLNPQLLDARIGVDESGKGDFFGQLCIAGVYVNRVVLEGWKGLGIRDSKKIGSDCRIAELAKVIRTTPGCVWSVVPIGNEAYNRLYGKLKRVDSMLAWGHARVIENLMVLSYQMKPLPVRAISDQFAHDKGVIANALMSLGRKIELVQRHRAEEDIAVAAASILARNEFVSRLAALGKRIEVELPKGSSEEACEVAREIVTKYGPDKLNEVAKTHFRLTQRAQGLPEPPRVPWRGREKKKS